MAQSGRGVTLVVLLALTAGVYATEYSNGYGKCGGTCRFQFCGYDAQQNPGVFAINAKDVDVPFTPAICEKKNKRIIGYVDETGEAYVEDHYGRRLISRWSPYGLRQAFSPSFFKSFPLDHVHRSGVGKYNSERRRQTIPSNAASVV
jgi:hypothetical protein